MNASSCNVTDDLENKEHCDIATQLIRVAETSRILVPTAVVLLLLIGAIGNVLVVIVSVTSQRIVQTPVYSRLVISIAIADLIYLISNATYYIESNLNSDWMYPAAFCPMFHYVSNLAVSAGIFSMCILAWLRFMGTAFPFYFRRCCLSSKKCGYWLIVGAWILAAVLAIPQAVYVRVDLTGNTYCVWTNQTASDACHFFYLTLTYILPLVSVIFFYTGIQRITTRMNMQHSRQANVPDVALSLMILGLIGAFLILWFPYHLYKLIIIFSSCKTVSCFVMRFSLKMTGQCMSYAHACINPIVYTFAVPTFRKHLVVDLVTFGRRLAKNTCPCFAKRKRVQNPEANDTEQPMMRASYIPSTTAISKMTLKTEIECQNH